MNHDFEARMGRIKFCVRMWKDMSAYKMDDKSYREITEVIDIFENLFRHEDACKKIMDILDNLN